MYTLIQDKIYMIYHHSAYRHIYVFNQIRRSGLGGVEGIAALPLLRELHASHNRIRDVGSLCLHEHLEVR